MTMVSAQVVINDVSMLVTAFWELPKTFLLLFNPSRLSIDNIKEIYLTLNDNV